MLVHICKTIFHNICLFVYECIFRNELLAQIYKGALQMFDACLTVNRLLVFAHQLELCQDGRVLQQHIDGSSQQAHLESELRREESGQ